MTDIPETALRARQSYAAGVPVKAILADSKFSLFKLYFWLDGAPQGGGTTLLPPIPRRKIVVHKPDPAETRAALVARMMRAAEMQLHDIEQRLAGAGYESGDSERNARALAVLARTLRELTAIEASEGSRKLSNEPGQSNDDTLPRNIDDIRRSLLEKLEALVAERSADLRLQAEG